MSRQCTTEEAERYAATAKISFEPNGRDFDVMVNGIHFATAYSVGDKLSVRYPTESGRSVGHGGNAHPDG